MSTPVYSASLTAESSSFVMDSAGRRVTGNVTIELMPGVGVGGPNGEHMDRENGPHTVPVAFAAPLLASRRARVVAPTPQADGDPGEEKKDENKEKVAPDAQVHGAPSGVQQRDPKARKR